MKRTVISTLLIGGVVVIFLGAASIVSIERNSGSLKTPAQADVGRDNSSNKPGQDDTISSGQTVTSKVPDNRPSPAFLPGMKFSPEGLTVKDDTFVFDSRRVDVNGDGKADDIVIVGEKPDNNNPYAQNISVAVKDGQNGKFSMASIGELDVGLEPKLFIGNFTGNNNDILVSFATGGSGGVYQYGLLTDNEDHLTSVIPQKELNEGLALETKCLPGFIMKVTDKNTGYTSTIDLHKGMADYERLGIYNETGKLLKDPLVLIDGFSVLKPELNGNGIYELHGIQRISVGYHANSAADAESVWMVTNGQLKLLSERIVPLN